MSGVDELENLQAGATDEDWGDKEPTPVPVLVSETAEAVGPGIPEEEVPQEESKAKVEAEEDKGKAERAEWDRERQERDQHHATERKELQGRNEQLVADKAASEARLAMLTERLSALETKPDEADSELTPDADAEDLVKTINDERKARKVLTVELAAVRQDLKTRDEKQQERDAKAEAKEAAAALKNTVKGMESEYGAKYSAEAQARAQKYFVGKGYDEDNPPPDVAVDLALDRFFREVQNEDPNRKPKASPKPSVPLDTGTGGGKETRSQGPMNNTEFKADLRRRGRSV